MHLEKINKEDLIFNNETGDDGINTKLILSEYDWMDYKLKTKIRTQSMGTLNISFNYKQN